MRQEEEKRYQFIDDASTPSALDIPIQPLLEVEEEITNTSEEIIPLDEEEEEFTEVEEGEGISDEEDDILEIDDNEEDEEEGEIQGDINPYNIFAEDMKKSGELPDDFEIPEDIDATGVYTAYKEHVKQSVTQELYTQVQQSLADNGVTNEDLFYARAFKTGALQQDISPILQAKSIVDKSQDAEISDSEKLEVIKAAHAERKLSSRDSKRILEAIEIEETLGEEFDESVSFFTKKHEKLVAAEQKRQDQKIADQSALKDREKAIIQGVFTSKKLLGKELSKEQLANLQRDLNTPSEVVELRDGKKFNATPIQKFLIDLQNSPELKLLAYHSVKYQDSLLQKVKNEAKIEEADKLADFLGGKTKKKTKKQKTNAPISKKKWSLL